MSFKPDIDPKTGRIDQAIALRGEPEFLAADADGRVYINLMDTHEVAVGGFKSREGRPKRPGGPRGPPRGVGKNPGERGPFLRCPGAQNGIVMCPQQGEVASQLP